LIADPALVSGILAVVNRAIAHALRYDPGTQQALTALNGKVIQLNCTAPEFSLFVVIDANALHLHSHYESPVDCTLTGSGRALIGLLGQDHHSLANTGVTVSGEPGLLAKIQQLIGALDIDWQEALGDVIGDTAAYPLAQVFARQSAWLRQRADRFPDWLNDVLTQELRLLPSADELETFYDDVNELRADTERLQARIEKLQRALDKPRNS
jgi:ubiquinone biosynthesis accessory factor UbiJ